MAISQWSTAPGTNATAADNIDWSEGMAPSLVNNSARQQMADVANWYRNSAEWIDRDDAVTYSSGSIVTITSQDVTSIYQVGRRIKITDSSTATHYGRITASSTSGANTQVTISWDSTGVLSTGAISDMAIGLVGASTAGRSVHLNALAGVSTFQSAKQGALVMQNATDDGYSYLISQGSTGQFLGSNGADADPSWQALPASGSWVLLDTQTASNSATIDFTSNIDSTYTNYAVLFYSVVPATDTVDLYSRVSVSSTFQTGSTDYDFVCFGQEASSATINAVNDTTRGQIWFQSTNSIGSDTAEGCGGSLILYNPSNTSLHKVIETNISFVSNAGNVAKFTGSGRYKGGTGAIDGLRFYFSSGNIESGTFKLYGIL